MRRINIFFMVLTLSLGFSGCLTTTQSLPGANTEKSSKDLIGTWILAEGEFAADVADNHHYLNIFLTPNEKDLIIVSAQDRIIEASEAFKICKEEGAICYDALIPETTILNDWKLINLTDHFAATNENFFLIMAYGLDSNGDLAVYNITDPSIKKAIADGKLTKQGDQDITSAPEQVIGWLKDLKVGDFKLYARYKRTQ